MSEAFDRLDLSSYLLMLHCQFSRGFVMETYASGMGLGAVLAQEINTSSCGIC